ncbi:hypothetical protein JW979_09270 [bacterium]|nr:hypothetical protein [candidate division CSSED10-310 bacterium]
MQFLQWGQRKANPDARFVVEIQVIEGQNKPVKDFNDYTKPILDAITDTKCLWAKVEQVTELNINSASNPRLPGSHVTIIIQESI